MNRYHSSGHALLELALVLPLLLIFLTVAFDLGVFLTDRGLTDNAVRVALNQVKRSENDSEIYFSRKVANALVNQLSNSGGSHSLGFLTEWQISVIPIDMTIDQATSRVTDIRFNHRASSHTQSSNQPPRLPLNEEEIRAQLTGAYGFAIFSLGERRYVPRVSAILISVKANPRGAHQPIVRKLLGAEFQIQRTIIVPIRSDYGQL